MKPVFSVREIVDAVGGSLSGSADGSVEGISTDSRTVEAGELFVPLKGERFDGHDYLSAVLGKGVRVFLSERNRKGAERVPSGASCIEVADTLRALGDLASFHRRRFSLPVVAVTGSNGKTTTKEMLAAILSRTGKGLKTHGNLNNRIGLPRMLFQLCEGHGWAVLEMGMSEPGEIDRLAEIARPHVGIVTNVTPAHLLSMGTMAAIAGAKGELFLRLIDGDFAVFNADDPLVAALPCSAGVHRISFGLGAAEVRAEDVRDFGRDGLGFVLVLPSGNIPVRMKVLGRHNLSNALAAAAAAYALRVSPEDIRDGLGSFHPFEKRFAPEEIGEILLIDDCYNANPASMRAALETLGMIKEGGRGIAVLGDMLELGPATAALHEELGRQAAASVERLYLLGGMARHIARGATTGGLDPSAILVAESHDEILAALLPCLTKGDCILVKGSRGMRMETIAEGVRTVLRSDSRKGAVN